MRADFEIDLAAVVANYLFARPPALSFGVELLSASATKEAAIRSSALSRREPAPPPIKAATFWKALISSSVTWALRIFDARSATRTSRICEVPFSVLVIALSSSHHGCDCSDFGAAKSARTRNPIEGSEVRSSRNDTGCAAATVSCRCRHRGIGPPHAATEALRRIRLDACDRRGDRRPRYVELGRDPVEACLFRRSAKEMRMA